MIERIEINLLPAEYRIHRKKIQIKREVAYPVLAAGVIALVLSLVSAGLQSTIWAHRNEIKALDQAIEQNRPIQNEINQLRDEKKVIQEKIRGLELISVNREKWVRLMEEISNRLPEYTWLTSIKEEAVVPPLLRIEGQTFSFPEVANFMSNMKDCQYISSVDLSQIEQVSPQEHIFRFSVSCAINDNAYLSADNQVAAAGGGGR
jgi:Tfp pilus assembly protein PilN